MSTDVSTLSALNDFHPCTAEWFQQAFDEPTRVQREAWPQIADGRNTLLLAPTGSGKTLAAFLSAIDRLFFREPDPAAKPSVKVIYISPLKALAVDVDRNLRAPIAGLKAFASRQGVEHHVPRVAVRSGDTSQQDRNQIVRNPPDILITTPESLYLMLTSQAERVLAGVETIIIDEIHAVAHTKRGSHLFLTLERLEYLRNKVSETTPPLQRIGLSATQRPLEEIAKLLGGGTASGNSNELPTPRPVQIVDASEKRRLVVTVESPAEDQQDSQSPQDDDIPIGSASSAPLIPSVWPSIHPRLVELIRQNRSTIIFVNSRRLAERLANAINDLAEEEIALAHHGSIAKEKRAEIEDRLKQGNLPAMVATSSMELGIDMGAVDLVIQIEAPPSIASGTQRIGRSGHHVGGVSTGIVVPKYKADLLACSAATGAMLDGWVEETRFPRNPLDVLAQQIVAICSREAMSVDDLYSLVRGAAPFFDLPRSSFESVLDLMSGRYPADEFADLRPRLIWDRINETVSPRKGSQKLAVLNGGTIPDRGLYGVFLIGDDGESGGRVGELDEEMVFETRPGDVFLLGASAWRVMDITRDRVMVLPAPGEPGRMPFWRGEGPGRPLEFGQAIGKLTRELLSEERSLSRDRLVEEHGLTEGSADALLDYLVDQKEATEEVPSDKTIVVEYFPDEVGDWRIVILSPFGARVHAPWAMLVSERMRTDFTDEVDVMWTDDGIIFRLPAVNEVPEVDYFFPAPETTEQDLIRILGGTALFSARFRENAARALLLPRRRPGTRTPLWLQRRRSSDLLKVASKYPSFPILMETFRECLQDVFDVSGLLTLLRSVQNRSVRIHQSRREFPSPFASAVMFNYVGNYIYDGDAPLAERRAATLSLDHNQLRELLGSADFRELFDPDVISLLADDLLRFGDYEIKHEDELHDVLLQIGPHSDDDIGRRFGDEINSVNLKQQAVAQLIEQRRAFKCRIADQQKLAAAEDAGRLRDALGVVPPTGLPDAFLEPVADAVLDLVSRYARTHVPFKAQDVAQSLGIGVDQVRPALRELVRSGRCLEGEFLPNQSGTEYCDSRVFQTLRNRSLAALRKQVEPVDNRTLARFIPVWHGIHRPRRGLDGLLDVVQQLQGQPLSASDLEDYILPARLSDYRPSSLDELCLAGEVVWQGVESTGPIDGRVMLFLTDDAALLSPKREPLEGDVFDRIRSVLQSRGAQLFDQISAATKEFPNDLLNDLWRLVWNGEVINDTLTPLRSLRSAARSRKTSARGSSRKFRSRRTGGLPGSEGRWSLFQSHEDAGPTDTERQTAIARQLLHRHGIVTKAVLSREHLAGGFSGVYPVWKAMEEAGQVRRGYFVAGLGGLQFSAPGAEDLLRTQRNSSEDAPRCQVLAATDPASPFGVAIDWPETSDSAKPQRIAGARVILRDGRVLAYLNRAANSLTTFSSSSDNDNESDDGRLIAETLARLASPGHSVLLRKIDGESAADSVFAKLLRECGFSVTSRGLLHKGHVVDSR